MNAPIPPQALVRPAGLPEDTDPQETAEWREAFLAQVHLCNPAVDRSACPAAYPR